MVHYYRRIGESPFYPEERKTEIIISGPDPRSASENVYIGLRVPRTAETNWVRFDKQQLEDFITALMYSHLAAFVDGNIRLTLHADLID